MPAAPPPTGTGIPPGLGKWIKSNAKFAYGAGAVGAGFAALDVKNIMDSDNKLKALLKTMKDFLLIRVMMAAFFTAAAAGMKALVRETGSLEAALKKLAIMQVFSRQLQGLVGGLGNARKRMSELAELSKKGPFKLESVAEANKSLEVFTRGAYSSVEATKEIGQVAIATGSDITDVARAVGGFYDALQSGRPVDEATEILRQMGAISQTTATSLNQMAESGMTTQQVFAQLQSALKITGSTASQYKDDIASVTAEHEKASEAMKAAFGAPFTAAEVQNTKNYTAAMQAFTPTIGALSKQLAGLYSGFNTATSAMVKWLASNTGVQEGSKVLLGLLQALTVVGVAFGAAAATTIIPAIIKLGNTFLFLKQWGTAATIAVRGLQAALIGSIFFTVAAAVVTLVGAIMNAREASKQAQKDFQDWVKSLDETTAALAAQAAAVQTLADKYAVMQKGIKQVVDAQSEMADNEKKIQDIMDRRKTIKDLMGTPGPAGGDSGAREKRLHDEDRRLKHEQEMLERRNRILGRTSKKAQEIIDATTKRSPAMQRMIEQEAEKRYAIEEDKKSVEEKERVARGGLEAEERVEAERAVMNQDILTQEEKLKSDRETFANRKLTGTKEAQQKERQDAKAAFEERQRSIDRQKAAAQNLPLTAGARLGVPMESSVALKAKVEQQQAAMDRDMLDARLKSMDKNAAGRRGVERAAESARTLAGGIAFDPTEKKRLEIEKKLAEKREAEAGRLGAEVPRVNLREFREREVTRGMEARGRGDIRGAQASEDFSRMADSFESFRASGFGIGKAQEMATERTRAEIQSGVAATAAGAVSSMAAIGGGGNLPGIDAQAEANKRMEALQQKMVDYLGILVGDSKDNGQQQNSQPVFAP